MISQTTYYFLSQLESKAKKSHQSQLKGIHIAASLHTNDSQKKKKTIRFFELVLKLKKKNTISSGIPASYGIKPPSPCF